MEVNRAVAIIRSPDSGNVYTFTKPFPSGGSLPELSAAELVQEDSQEDVVLCLDAGAPLSGGRMGVIIKSGASSQSFVQTIVDDPADGEVSC